MSRLPSPASRRALTALTALLLGLVGSGCGKKVTESDCTRVGEHLRVVWQGELTRATPESGAVSERGALVAGAEGEKVASTWTTQCKREVEGRRFDQAELDCLLAAKSIAEVGACAAPR